MPRRTPNRINRSHDEIAAATTPLGRFIKKRRDALGLTQNDLSRLTGMPQDEVSKWEIGTLQGLKPEKAQVFAKALQVSYRDLWMAFGGVEPDMPDPPGILTNTWGEVIPEFARLFRLDPSPQEAAFLVDALQAQRRLMNSLYQPGEEAADDTPDNGTDARDGRGAASSPS